jgi:hypothetical protein
VLGLDGVGLIEVDGGVMVLDPEGCMVELGGMEGLAVFGLESLILASISFASPIA